MAVLIGEPRSATFCIMHSLAALTIEAFVVPAKKRSANFQMNALEFANDQVARLGEPDRQTRQAARSAYSVCRRSARKHGESGPPSRYDPICRFAGDRRTGAR